MLEHKQLLKYAQTYGTPLFVYDADLVRERYRDLFGFIPYPKLEIHYALKANYQIGILEALRDEGCGIDAVSPAEVELALKLGFAKESVIYTANNMTDAEFERVYRSGVTINVGSLSRLGKLAARHPGARICLRFNPDVVDGDSANTMTGGDLTKFGILLDKADEVKRLVNAGNLHVIGLHSHTGSGLQKPESVYQSMKNLMAIATRDNFPELEFMDFGGGFKVPYKPDEKRIDYVTMGAEIARLFAEHCKNYGRELKLLFEPGKYLVAECGYLLTTVNTLKFNRTRVIAGCDSGFPQLIRPVLYGAYHQIFNLGNPEGPEKLYDVCGNICETGDRFAEQRPLPEIREGDVLAIANAGAYCYSMGGVYNLRTMPAEIVVSQGKVTHWRPRTGDEELVDSLLAATKKII